MGAHLAACAPEKLAQILVLSGTKLEVRVQ